VCLPRGTVGEVAVTAPSTRTLSWEGCHNVRDLGGLETLTGSRTRHGTVVRADNVRRLTAAGHRAMLDHGVRRVVDLRFENEEPGEPDLPAEVEVMSISLFGRHDPEEERRFDERVRDAEDVSAVFAAGYVRTLASRPDRVADAVAAVADTDDAHAVLVHCFAGKDRTGIVVALLLGAVGVRDEIIAADYAESDVNMNALFGGWVGTAPSAAEAELRRRIIRAPHATITAVLAWLREDAGGPESYLRSAGLSAAQLARLRRRLVGS
jgi:protein-tyrosine phosphatase